MSEPTSPSILTASALAVSLALAQGAALQADSRSQAHPTAGPDSGGAVVALEQPFVLDVGETALIEGGLAVTFAAVTGESRCPTDVQCVWEGNAEVAIDVVAPGEHEASLSLNTNPNFATEAAYHSYRVELTDLEPYPRTDIETAQPYRATLVVNPLGAQNSPLPSASPSPTAPT